ncbi:hypothetical protein AAAC51_11545 [Priestia megaterium]
MYDLNANSDISHTKLIIALKTAVRLITLHKFYVKSLHKNLQSNGGKYGLWIRAYERSPITNLTIRHSNFQHVATSLLMENVKDLYLKSFV